MPKVLVTGGAGFIGSHLVEGLVRLGFQVTVADDLSTGNRGYVPRSASFRKIDIRTRAFRQLIKNLQPDYLCHLAAQRSAVSSLSRPVPDADINIIGTVNTLAAAADLRLKKFLFVSTAAVYGTPRQIPVPEEADIQLTSPYAVAKYAAERYVSYYDASGQLPTVIVRLSNVYGPRQAAGAEGGVVAKFALALLTNQNLVIEGRGEQTRDFLFVKDAVDGLIKALQTGRGIFNLSSGREISIRELVVHLGEVVGSVPSVSYAPQRPGDILRSSLLPLRAKRELDWQAVTPLTDGLRQTLKWYKELI